MKWKLTGNELPGIGVDVLLRSTQGKYFIGRLKESGNFRVVSKVELQEDGGWSQLTTGIYKTSFTHWLEIEPPTGR